MNRTVFEAQLASLINLHSAENGSDTPDFILAMYLNDCLICWNTAMAAREKWYGREIRVNATAPVEISADKASS